MLLLRHTSHCKVYPSSPKNAARTARPPTGHTCPPQAGSSAGQADRRTAGLPVLGNLHPTSPVKHVVSGFLSDEPSALRGYAKMLLEDKRLATLMGQKARKTALECFPMSKFKQSFMRSIETDRRKWQEKPA